MIILKSQINPQLSIRLLHVQPEVSVGTKLCVGDHLGKYVRSGYFNFWTDPHVHIEIRKPQNLIRARGGFPMKRIPNKQRTDETLNVPSPTYFPLQVTSIQENYLFAKSPNMVRIGPFWGIESHVKEQSGILDGGIPQYGYGGIHLNSTTRIQKNDPVSIGDIILGHVIKIASTFALFKTSSIEVQINNRLLRGFTAFLHLQKPQSIKFLPIQSKDLRGMTLNTQWITLNIRKEEGTR
jgi:hypothetical protein